MVRILGRKHSDGYTLSNEDLLEYDGLHGSRALCHLLIYPGGGRFAVCVVGNFDGGLGTSTTNAVQVVATAIDDRMAGQEFRLIEWYPHRSQPTFSEVALTRVAPTQLPYGQVVAGAPDELHAQGHSITVRFADPRWTARTEDEVAALLGQPAVRDLRSYAGLSGDYTPERLFGDTGRRRAQTIRAHNREVFGNLDTHLSEWT